MQNLKAYLTNPLYKCQTDRIWNRLQNSSNPTKPALHYQIRNKPNRTNHAPKFKSHFPMTKTTEISYTTANPANSQKTSIKTSFSPTIRYFRWSLWTGLSLRKVFRLPLHWSKIKFLKNRPLPWRFRIF